MSCVREWSHPTDCCPVSRLKAYTKCLCTHNIMPPASGIVCYSVFGGITGSTISGLNDATEYQPIAECGLASRALRTYSWTTIPPLANSQLGVFAMLLFKLRFKLSVYRRSCLEPLSYPDKKVGSHDCLLISAAICLLVSGSAVFIISATRASLFLLSSFRTAPNPPSPC